MATDPYINLVRTLWASGSYRYLTVKLLSHRAGNSTSVFYQLHKTKNSLFAKVLSSIQDELVDVAASAATHESLQDRLYQSMEALLRAFESNPLYRNAYRDSPILEAEMSYRPWTDVLAEVLKRAGLKKPVPQPVLGFYVETLKSLYLMLENIKKEDRTAYEQEQYGSSARMVIKYLSRHLSEE